MGMPVIEPSTITCEEAIGNIIYSIAEEEKAIAHILNAESEKLQAVIDMPEVTAEELLAVNCSVKKTVDTAIRLEIMLKSKLQLLSKSICATK